MVDDKIFQTIHALDGRLDEDALYEKVLIELKNGEIDIVAEARATEEASGEKQKARAFYIKHRIRRLRDLAVANELSEHLSALEEEQRQKEFDKEQKRVGDLLRQATSRWYVSPELKVMFSEEFEDWLGGKSPDSASIYDWLRFLQSKT